MATAQKTQITVEVNINAPVEKVWEMLNDPKHITQWNAAIDTWHCPSASNDLRPGGKLKSRMEAKDGSFGFDFEGTYDEVKEHELIRYHIADGREVVIKFDSDGNQTKLSETFEAEDQNPAEMQRGGWQSILDNFKKYVESSSAKTGDKLHFSIHINAPVEKVYSNMIGKETYTQWTEPFNPGSTFEGSWDKGSKILFVGNDKNGDMGGMVSRIKENIPNQFISIEHLGMLQGGKEITSGPEVDSWAGALENYTYMPEGDGTLLQVDLDSNDEMASFFQDTFPKALEILKRISEA